ncbi:hypothetical protein [Streptomyces sp. NBC_01304]|uniref:hypothetical protein n=1 Tax=Streptomyces sp. NBC_01304 TaxID=2903818 RepID=UPI002E139735|nr:hypothetical protein OG430_19930 [Streptomyces sp. NBC_01304]
MAPSTLARAAVTGLSLLALALPASAAQALDAAPKPPCAAYEKTVERHKATIGKMTVDIEELELTAFETDSRVEYAHVVWYEARDAYRDLSEDAEEMGLTEDDLAELMKQRDEAYVKYQKAQEEDRAASAALKAAESSPELAKAKQLLARAEKALQTCLDRQA